MYRLLRPCKFAVDSLYIEIGPVAQLYVFPEPVRNRTGTVRSWRVVQTVSGVTGSVQELNLDRTVGVQGVKAMQICCR